MAARAGADGGVHPGNGKPIGWPSGLVGDKVISSWREPLPDARSTLGRISRPGGWDTIRAVPMSKRLALFVPIVLGIATIAWAQFRGGGSSVDAHLARDDSFDGKFHYCRAVYR